MLAFKTPAAIAPVTVVDRATGQVVKAPAPVRSASVSSGSDLLSSPLLWIVAGVILLVSLER